MSKIERFEDIKAWQKARELSTERQEIYQKCLLVSLNTLEIKNELK